MSCVWHGSLTVKASHPEGTRHRLKLENPAQDERARPRRCRRHVLRTYQLRLSSQTLTPQIASSTSVSALRRQRAIAFLRASLKQYGTNKVCVCGGGGTNKACKHTMSATAYKPWNGQAMTSKRKMKASAAERYLQGRQVTKHTISCNARNKTSKTPRSWRFRPTASQHSRGWKVCERVLTVRPRKHS